MEAGDIRGQRMQAAQVKDRLKSGSTSLRRVLQEAQSDDAIGGMRVLDLLESLPGIGKDEARRIMKRLGIAESALVRELKVAQRAALESEHRQPTGVVGSTPSRDYEDEDEDEGEGTAPEERGHPDAGYGIEDWDRR